MTITVVVTVADALAVAASCNRHGANRAFVTLVDSPLVAGGGGVVAVVVAVVVVGVAVVDGVVVMLLLSSLLSLLFLITGAALSIVAALPSNHSTFLELHYKSNFHACRTYYHQQPSSHNRRFYMSDNASV